MGCLTSDNDDRKFQPDWQDFAGMALIIFIIVFIYVMLGA